MWDDQVKITKHLHLSNFNLNAMYENAMLPLKGLLPLKP